MVKLVIANYYGHEVLVENSWLGGARLFLDGECCDENRALFALDKNAPLLRAVLEIEGRRRTVEVFFLAIFTVKIKICVDGKQIGGEVF